MTRWSVWYLSGRHVTVMASDEAGARLQGALLWPDDPVTEVKQW